MIPGTNLSPGVRPQVVPVPETQLPVILPTGVEFKGHGPSPLSQDEAWLMRGDCGKLVLCHFHITSQRI